MCLYGCKLPRSAERGMAPGTLVGYCGASLAYQPLTCLVYKQPRLDLMIRQHKHPAHSHEAALRPVFMSCESASGEALKPEAWCGARGALP